MHLTTNKNPDISNNSAYGRCEYHIPAIYLGSTPSTQHVTTRIANISRIRNPNYEKNLYGMPLESWSLRGTHVLLEKSNKWFQEKNIMLLGG